MLALNTVSADPISLPAPPGILAWMLVITFLLHVVPMNLALGCSLIAPWAAWRGRSSPESVWRTLSHQLTSLLPVFLALAITLGVAPLLFLQTLLGRFFFTSSILMGWFWLAVVPLLFTAYSLAYRAAWRRHPTEPPKAWMGLFTALLLALVAFLFSNNMSRMIRPQSFAEVYRANPRGLTLNIFDPSLWPRYFHFLIASVAVSGLFLAFLAMRGRAHHGENYSTQVLRLGSSLFVHPTLLQLLVGPWLLVSLPPEIRILFLGGRTPETAALGFGVLFALVAVTLVLQAPNRPRPAPPLVAAGVFLLASLSLMVTVRHFLRRAALSNLTEPTPVSLQPWAMTLFVILLFAVLTLIAYMLHMWWRASRN